MLFRSIPTPKRKRWTYLAAFLALSAGALAMALFTSIGQTPLSVAIMQGSYVPLVVWVLATILIWRETPEERMDRVSGACAEYVCCPVCGYNMTGLQEARCPECGARFTLDEFLAAQPRDKDEGLQGGS